MRLPSSIRKGSAAAGLLALTLARTGAPQAPSPTPPPAFPAGVEMVTVDVVVTDKKGRPVPGLAREDFVVAEDGTPQPIATFEAIDVTEAAEAAPAPAPSPRVSTNLGAPARPGRSFVIVFDDLHLSPPDAERARRAVEDFLRGGLQEGDLVTLVPTSGGAWWSARMEAGRDDLLAVLGRLEGRRVLDASECRITDYDAMRIYAYRDAQVENRVLRWLYDCGALADAPTSDARARKELDISPGRELMRARAADAYNRAIAGEQATLRAIERVLESLAASRGRKSVILVSEGFIHEPRVEEFRRVIGASRHANAAVYFLDARGLTGLPALGGADVGRAVQETDLSAALAEAPHDAEGSDSVALDSGGFSVRNDLAGGLERIAGESRAYYLIGYQPTNTRRDGKFRKIRVEVRRAGLEVRARKGYYAPGEAEKLRREPEKLDPAVREALDSPYETAGIPLRMTSYVFGETAGGRASVLLVAEADPSAFAFEAEKGRLVDSLETFLLVASRETGGTERQERLVDLSLPPEVLTRLRQTWLPIHRELGLAPGVYQARLAVRDRNGKRIGTVLHGFEVSALGRLRTSSPVLTDALEPAPGGAQGPPRPVPVARRTFFAGERLFCQFDVYDAARDAATGMPRVSAGFVVRRSDGTTLAKADPTPIAPGPHGELSRLMAIPLQGAVPARYELVLTVRDEVAGRGVEAREPFVVEAPGGGAAALSGTGGPS